MPHPLNLIEPAEPLSPKGLPLYLYLQPAFKATKRMKPSLTLSFILFCLRSHTVNRGLYQNLRRMPAFSFHFLWKSPPRSLAKSA